MRCGDLLLYAVTDRGWSDREHPFIWQVEEALKGGVTMLQLREKELSKEECYREALEVQRLCRQYQVPFLINDHVELACCLDADGVHVGQTDMEASLVREKIGKEKILGVSVQTVEQAVLAQRQGADYLGVGAIFATQSKADAQAVEIEVLRQIVQTVSIPVIAIGGIVEENLDQLAGTGICGVAVIRAVFAQKEIQSAVLRLRRRCEQLFEIGGRS